eukprot:TRINITY_DN19070_c0_g1_i1.p1 TRINITY_DN19070_c0_g1~~TRINITY_DN19070_c0_g1_i1.p1  ORF type:complete len:221 (+),score=24.54 TRINITY_DN19070_c0_g1_i1:30-692(+)
MLERDEAEETHGDCAQQEREAPPMQSTFGGYSAGDKLKSHEKCHIAPSTCSTPSVFSSSSLCPKPPGISQPPGVKQRPGARRWLRPASVTHSRASSCPDDLLITQVQEQTKTTEQIAYLANCHPSVSDASLSEELSLGFSEGLQNFKRHNRINERRKKLHGPALTGARQQSRRRVTTMYNLHELYDQDASRGSVDGCSDEDAHHLSDSEPERTWRRHTDP